uniref:GDNF/GAS1 domain-containing protein n=1 Tax=Hippocampus comes TaxID=109280 RepID=A0A3Q3DHV1_HIPCM
RVLACKKTNNLFLHSSEVPVFPFLGCQIKGTEVCNLTIQAALDRFAGPPASLSLNLVMMLLSHTKRRGIDAPLRQDALHVFLFVEDAAGSCTQQMRLCVSDGVCNKNLAPVLQTCTASQCDHESCGQETQRFYSSMPQHVAERLVMCECDPSDASCLQMEAALHGSSCLGVLYCTSILCMFMLCCRELLTSFQAKCWSSAESYCGDITLQSECLRFMDPALILGGDLECRKAFVALLGTPLHHPCTCEQIHVIIFFFSASNSCNCYLSHQVIYSIAARRHWWWEFWSGLLLFYVKCGEFIKYFAAKVNNSRRRANNVS